LLLCGLSPVLLDVRQVNSQSFRSNAQPAPHRPESEGGTPEFEVASIRQDLSDVPQSSNVPLGPGDVYASNGGLFKAINVPLIAYIAFAYRIMGNQTQYVFAQLPRWVEEDRFDIEARSDGQPTKDQLRLMMRSLLAERFKLIMHDESRTLPVLALELVQPRKTGPQLQPHPASDAACSVTLPGDAMLTPNAAVPQTVAGGFPKICGGIYPMSPSVPGRMRLGGRNVTMQLIANALPTRELDRRVVDQTGMNGTFDFNLEWSPVATPGVDSQLDESGPNLLLALKEQLGLKLSEAKAPFNMMVIDHTEMPSQN